MKVGDKIELLVNSRYCKKGDVGLVDKVLDDGAGQIDMNWENSTGITHHIFMRKETEGEFWRFSE
ncbi:MULTISPECIES: hypothetical protein [unclassified Psychrobacillus]|uniref:hypothetical protein n=1 Tax=unclassified Psychrobacillus TaxID=2636677 RepID=UPI0030FAE211